MENMKDEFLFKKSIITTERSTVPIIIIIDNNAPLTCGEVIELNQDKAEE